MNREPGQRYEILKIWLPTHSVVNVYRSPRGEYQVTNGSLLGRPTNEYGYEKIRILPSHGGVITVKRDKRIAETQYKYTLEPTLNMEATSVRVDNWPYFKMGDEQSGTVQVVRIGQDFQPAEVTIFYSPHDGFEVHNGYLAEKKRITRYGSDQHRLTIVTSAGKRIIVRRYVGTGEIRCEPAGYWVEQTTVTL